MKKLLIIALVALVFASCEKEVIVEKIVEVPVEVDTSDMPEGLKAIVNYEGWIFESDLNAYCSNLVAGFSVDIPNLLVVTYGDNTVLENSDQAPKFPREIVTIVAYMVDDYGYWTYRGHYHAPNLPNGEFDYSIPEEETFPYGQLPIFNKNFYPDEYVYKIITM